MKVKRWNLFILAAMVWMIAGFLVMRIGIANYNGYTGRILYGLSFGVFLVFWIGVFAPLVRKHTARICAYDEEMQPIYLFFDKKSFVIMAFVLVFDIAVRKMQLWPLQNIAVCYTGLGAALFCTGGAFLAEFFLQKKRQQWKEEEIQRQKAKKAAYQHNQEGRKTEKK